MKRSGAFEILKQAFQEAVDYATRNGMAEIGKSEIRRSELWTAVCNEATRKLDKTNKPYQGNQIADVATGRRKYEEHIELPHISENEEYISSAHTRYKEFKNDN